MNIRINTHKRRKNILKNMKEQITGKHWKLNLNQFKKKYERKVYNRNFGLHHIQDDNMLQSWDRISLPKTKTRGLSCT